MDIEKLAERLAKVIQERRMQAGMSHEQLGVAAGLDRSTISLYESGRRVPTVTSAARVAGALGMKLSDLIAEAEAN